MNKSGKPSSCHPNCTQKWSKWAALFGVSASSSGPGSVGSPFRIRSSLRSSRRHSAVRICPEFVGCILRSRASTVCGRWCLACPHLRDEGQLLRSGLSPWLLVGSPKNIMSHIWPHWDKMILTWYSSVDRSAKMSFSACATVGSINSLCDSVEYVFPILYMYCGQ